MNEDIEKIEIDSDDLLLHLIKRFSEQPGFAKAFVFANDDLYNRFFEGVNIDLDLFQKKYYYFDKEHNIHIAESESGIVWISTLGLVTTSKMTNNSYVNSYSAQSQVLLLLLDEIIAICSNENCYDIDGALYERLKELTPALFHNTVFYYETFAKAYLSLSKCKVPKTHELSSLYEKFNQAIVARGHEKTIFHEFVNPSFLSMRNHISSIPGDFKEHNIKYDDNSGDTTFIQFDIDDFKAFRNIVTVGMDAIFDLYYSPTDPLYFKKAKAREGETIEQ